MFKQKKIMRILSYTGYSVLIIAICILFFSTKKTDGKPFIVNENGNRIDIERISQKDTSKKSSLDGDAKFNTPTGFSDMPFDPNAPFTLIKFKTLRTYIPGKDVPNDVRDLNNKNVEIRGFMTPLSALQGMNEFLLCSTPPLNCYCAPPVFINEIIYVKLMNGQTTDFLTGVVSVKGQLKVNFDIKDEYSDVIYTIDASSVQ
jgi:hypothetical protein